jgi:hypothetical protein
MTVHRSTEQSEHATQPRRHSFGLAGVVFTVVFFIQTFYVKLFGVNIPFWDEWDYNGPLQTIYFYRIGDLTWQRLFDQHFDHRIALAKIIFVALYGIFGEANLLSYMVFSAVLTGLITAIWAYAVHRLGMYWWVIVASIFVLVSPMQYENILWGFQISFYILVLGTVALVALIALSPSLNWRTIAIAIGCCIISTFSIVAGVFAWPVALACIGLKYLLASDSFGSALRSRALLARLVTVAICGATVVGLYFSHYTLNPIGARARRIWATCSCDAIGFGRHGGVVELPRRYGLV